MFNTISLTLNLRKISLRKKWQIPHRHSGFVSSPLAFLSYHSALPGEVEGHSPSQESCLEIVQGLSAKSALGKSTLWRKKKLVWRERHHRILRLLKEEFWSSVQGIWSKLVPGIPVRQQKGAEARVWLFSPLPQKSSQVTILSHRLLLGYLIRQGFHWSMVWPRIYGLGIGWNTVCKCIGWIINSGLHPKAILWSWISQDMSHDSFSHPLLIR